MQNSNQLIMKVKKIKKYLKMKNLISQAILLIIRMK